MYRKIVEAKKSGDLSQQCSVRNSANNDQTVLEVDLN
ncbi:MAG: hypothetical protein ACI8QQ_002442 [Psychroserpens sp.]|jgi:hypothetical protein